ncbi:hypothetical protein SAMN05444483_10339 [Salegentibacter echinorum]|uniref:Uncharacterized protein n=1 Tax=Salegentibacter echinorum TaxID=1073325 RepID=A0A1M5F5W5_SALEC|nr:hypothetical protein SAMN05444483_10339 [Salegentibacter echinorum]
MRSHSLDSWTVRSNLMEFYDFINKNENLK